MLEILRIFIEQQKVVVEISGTKFDDLLAEFQIVYVKRRNIMTMTGKEEEEKDYNRAVDDL